jgi:hypothetical protein
MRWRARGSGVGLAARLAAALCVVAVAGVVPARAAASGWSARQLIDPTVTASRFLEAVDCPSSSFCVAVDDNGNAIFYRDGTWGKPTVAASGDSLSSLSCASESFCVAAGPGAGGSLIYRGGTWSAVPVVIGGGGNGSPEVSCPTASFCAALGQDGASVETFDGASWSGPVDIGVNLAAGYSLQAISCVSSRFCVVVDAAGTAYLFNGTSWTVTSRVDTLSAFASVSCVSPSFCVAVDQLGHEQIYNGVSWSKPDRIDLSGPLEAVSCATSALCAATDANTGEVFVYDGRGWSGVVADHLALLVSVSCPTSAFCLAVDDLGGALVYRGRGSPGGGGREGAPRVRVRTSLARASSTGLTRVRLQCSGLAARGQRRGRVMLRVIGLGTIASARYRLADNATRAVALHLDQAGLAALRHARRHRLSATITLTVAGGSVIRHSITLQLR